MQHLVIRGKRTSCGSVVHDAMACQKRRPLEGRRLDDDDEPSDTVR